MNNTIIRILEKNIINQLAGYNVGGGIALSGKPGIGKTTTFKSICNKHNYKLVHVSIPEISSEELSGIPDFISYENNQMDKYSTNMDKDVKGTIWSVPQLIDQANKLAEEMEESKFKYDGIVLLIDDLHRVGMSVAPYLYALFGERKLGNYMLNERVAIMGAMNDSDEAGFEGVDSPIKDRIGILHVDFDFNWWFANYGRNLDIYTSSFLKAYPNFVEEDESTGIEQFGTPRSLTFLSNEVLSYIDEDFGGSKEEKEFFIENAEMIASQKISHIAASEFKKHITYMETINFRKIIDDAVILRIQDLKVLDQILYSYIINYVHNFKDAAYLVKLIDNNFEDANFVGSVISEIYNKFKLSSSGKTISDGNKLIINTLMKTPFNPKDYNVNDKKALEIGEKLEFENYDAIMEIASAYLS